MSHLIKQKNISKLVSPTRNDHIFEKLLAKLKPTTLSSLLIKLKGIGGRGQNSRFIRRYHLVSFTLLT